MAGWLISIPAREKSGFGAQATKTNNSDIQKKNLIFN